MVESVRSSAVPSFEERVRYGIEPAEKTRPQHACDRIWWNLDNLYVRYLLGPAWKSPRRRYHPRASTSSEAETQSFRDRTDDGAAHEPAWDRISSADFRLESEPTNARWYPYRCRCCSPAKVSPTLAALLDTKTHLDRILYSVAVAVAVTVVARARRRVRTFFTLVAPLRAAWSALSLSVRARPAWGGPARP